VAVVVVGYTKADEGEFIGAEGTSHLVALMPGPDDPAEVAAFEARVAADPWPDPPTDAVGPADSGGNATGGDRRSLRLHDHDEELLAAVAAANPRTIAVLVGGSAVVVEGWRASVPAIVQAWYGGMEGGHGLADVLLGRVDATGRLPFSVPTDEGHLPPFDPDADAVTYDAWHGYWRLERDAHAPRFPFGFGLSYTTWDVELVESGWDEDLDDRAGTWDQRVAVTNTGRRDGATVVQVYARRPGRAQRRLVGFARVELGAGQRAEVDIPISTQSLAVREAGRWVLPEGTYELSVGLHAGHVADAVTARVRATVRG
jgi:hypothetical protein